MGHDGSGRAKAKGYPISAYCDRADPSGDLGLLPANLDGRAGILPALPRLAALGFQGIGPATAASKALPAPRRRFILPALPCG